MPFYYRAKTGIPGLYYVSGGRYGRKNGVIGLLALAIVGGSLMIGVIYLLIKYTFVLFRWSILFLLDLIKRLVVWYQNNQKEREHG